MWGRGKDVEGHAPPAPRRRCRPRRRRVARNENNFSARGPVGRAPPRPGEAARCVRADGPGHHHRGERPRAKGGDRRGRRVGSPSQRQALAAVLAARRCSRQTRDETADRREETRARTPSRTCRPRRKRWRQTRWHAVPHTQRPRFTRSAQQQNARRGAGTTCGDEIKKSRR